MLASRWSLSKNYLDNDFRRGAVVCDAGLLRVPDGTNEQEGKP
jgi:hypothetical protein